MEKRSKLSLSDEHACSDAECFYTDYPAGNNTNNNPEGYKVFDPAHHQLTNTTTIQLENDHYCAYCLNKAKEVQGNYLKSFQEDDTVTGYTCVCQQAINERTYNVEYQTLLDNLEKTMNGRKAYLGISFDELDLAHKASDLVFDLAITVPNFRFNDQKSPTLNDNRVKPVF